MKIISKSIQNNKITYHPDRSSAVECHSKVNGIDEIEDNIRIYIGTNFLLDFFLQSLIWVFLISLIPKSNKVLFNNLNLKFFIAFLLLYLHLYSEQSYYEQFVKEFDLTISLDNYFLLNILIILYLLIRILNTIIQTRVGNLLNYFPFIFLLIGTYNNLNLNFYIFLFIILGLEAILKIKLNKSLTLIYFGITLSGLFINFFTFKKEITYFDIDKLKGFSSSNYSFGSSLFWIVIYFLISAGVYYLFVNYNASLDLGLIKKNFLISGSLITLFGFFSSINSLINFGSYYYLGLNKFGISQVKSIEGNTWRGISASAESVGEFYAYAILFFILYHFFYNIKITKFEYFLILVNTLGAFRSNNVAAISSVIFLLFIFFSNNSTISNLKIKIFVYSILGTATLSIFLVTNTYTADFYSKALLSKSVESAQFNYELQGNQWGLNAIDQINFGEILILEEKNRSTSSTLFFLLKSYNNENNINYIPSPITIISAISIPINRSEKWGIFISKYDPNIYELFFGYGPNQIAYYYLHHPTKNNTGLILPHSSLLDYLLFFGLFGVALILIFISNLLFKNYKNKFFIYLFLFLIINLLKSDSLMYMNSLLLLLFTINLASIKNNYYET